MSNPVPRMPTVAVEVLKPTLRLLALPMSPVNGQETTETASGDGPVNALCEAMNRITGLQGEIQTYRIQSVTGGADAQGEVHVRVRFPDGLFTGRAASTDIVHGSAQAYLDAINKVFIARTCRESLANTGA